jgi:hypothetical protein
MFIYDVHLRARPGEAAQVERRLTEPGGRPAAPTGSEATVWKVLAGAPLGCFVVTRRLAAAGDLVDTDSALEPSLQRMLGSASAVIAGPGPCLDRIVATNGRTDAARLMSVTRTVAADGCRSAAAAWGVDALHHLVSLTGASGMITTAVAGTTGGIGWRLGVESCDALAGMADRLDADATWLEMVESADELFVPGASTRLILARL